MLVEGVPGLHHRRHHCRVDLTDAQPAAPSSAPTNQICVIKKPWVGTQPAQQYQGIGWKLTGVG